MTSKGVAVTVPRCPSAPSASTRTTATRSNVTKTQTTNPTVVASAATPTTAAATPHTPAQNTSSSSSSSSAPSQVLADRRGTAQLKRSEQSLQEKTRLLEEQLEQTRAQHAEEIKRLQSQLDNYAARFQQEDKQEAKAKEQLAEMNLTVQQLEGEKAHLQRALESVGIDAVTKRKVASEEGARVKEALSEIREHVRSEGLVLQEIQESVRKTALLLGHDNSDEMDLTE